MVISHWSLVIGVAGLSLRSWNSRFKAQSSNPCLRRGKAQRSSRIKLGLLFSLLALINIFPIDSSRGQGNGQKGDQKVSLTTQEIEEARRLYELKCSGCHGMEGKGDGPAAPFLDPKPRDFTRSLYKIRSTPSGSLPTDEDLFKVITDGMPGTSMPDWKTLSERQRWLLVQYTKRFSQRFAETTEPPKPMLIGKEIPLTEESLAKGKELYRDLECFKCHGEEGRGNQAPGEVLKDDWGFILRASNLTKSWQFRGGSSTKDILRTFMTGLAGTPMPSYADSIDEEMGWHLSNYVKSLSLEKKEGGEAILKAKFIEVSLPNDLKDPLWQKAEPVDIPLMGQLVFEPRQFTPSIESVTVRSLYNDKEIAFLLEWDDSTESIPGKKIEGGPPEVYADGLAIQFPSKIPEGFAKPYFIMGDTRNPVNLWQWKFDSKTITEINASGLGKRTEQKPENQDAKGSGSYSHGRYKLIMRRTLETKDKEKDIQFQIGKFIPFTFLVWDGSNGEKDGKMTVSSWYYLILEKPSTRMMYMYPFLAIILTVALEAFSMRRIRRTEWYSKFRV